MVVRFYIAILARASMEQKESISFPAMFFPSRFDGELGDAGPLLGRQGGGARLAALGCAQF